MRPQQCDGLGEFVARTSPAEFLVRNIALVTVRKAEMLTNFGDAVEFVLRQILRQPVAAIVSKVEFLCYWVPVEAD